MSWGRSCQLGQPVQWVLIPRPATNPLALQTTRIGVAVNGVRKHCSDKEVVSLAKVLIRNWKQLLGERGRVAWAKFSSQHLDGRCPAYNRHSVYGC